MISGANNWAQRLLEFDTCAVSDALDALHLPAAVTGLRPLTVDTPIAGPVLTVKLGPRKPPVAAQRHLATAAVEAARRGDIIVIEHSSGIDCAGWGGVLSAGALANGVAGVVIDGDARDIGEAKALNFAIYGRGATARTARGRVYEQAFGCSVSIGGVTVSPGDLVLADVNGIAFIPIARAEDVLRQAQRISAKEQLMIAALRRGESITRVVGRDYESMLDQVD